MKTPKRILALASSTNQGHRASAHEEFRAVVEANGYIMSRGGYVKDLGGNHICRGWAAFSEGVLAGDILLSEPAAIAELEDVEELEAEEMAADALRLAPVIQLPVRETEPETGDRPVDITYLYATRSETIILTDRSVVTGVIHEAVTGLEEGACESGAAFGCLGEGFRRVLPESMAPGQERESMIQCVPCYEYSADKYIRLTHGSEA